MPTLYGKTFTRAELIERGGDMRQFGGVRLGELADGAERGVRTADIRTGSGLEFTVLADRGLDIGAASYRGASLAWHSPTPFAHPAFYEPEGLGWLRGFGGGLMTTCGLTYFGAPTVDEGQPLGLHGHASNLPATNLACGGDWHGDEYELWVSGQMREARLFGENMVLRRRISTRLGRVTPGGRRRGHERRLRDDPPHDALPLQPGLPCAQRGLRAADQLEDAAPRR